MSDEKNPDEQPVQQIQHSSATARIPDEIGRGVFATAVIVLHGPNEYTIDFIQSLARPNRVAARIILPPVVANQFVLALEQALEKYRNAFGHLPHEPQPSQSDQKHVRTAMTLVMTKKLRMLPKQRTPKLPVPRKVLHRLRAK